MDLHYSQTKSVKIALSSSFTTLWIYTTLKHPDGKAEILGVLLPYGFTLLSNLFNEDLSEFLFYYLMDLHYSQTDYDLYKFLRRFYYLMDLHYSQTVIHIPLCFR